MTTVRAGARRGSALAVGSVLNGVLAYVFFALVTRALGPDAAAPVSVLWAWWAFAAAALTFPVQHWVTRSVAAHHGEGGVRAALPRVGAAVLALAVLTTVVSWLLRNDLFATGAGAGAAAPDWVFPLLTGGTTAGSALSGLVRGTLAARRRFTALAVNLVAENAVRAVAAAVLMAAGNDAPGWYGACLLVGFAGTLLWPDAMVPRADGTGPADGTWTFLGGAAGGQLVGQAVLTGGPVLLALAGGAPAEVTALFAGLALFRAPYTVAVGMVGGLTGWFTRLVGGRDLATLRRLRLAGGGALVAGGPLALLVGWYAGPPLLRLVFGQEVELSAGACAVVAVGSAVALVNLAVTVMLLAQGRTPALVGTWLVALLPGALWFAAGPGGPLTRTTAAFVVVEVAALVGLVTQEWRGAPRPGASPR